MIREEVAREIFRKIQILKILAKISTFDWENLKIGFILTLNTYLKYLP